MFKNYWIIAWRNLFKHRLYTFINVLGLALGIACFTTLFLLVRYELSYDTWHSQAKHIYRITEFAERNGVGERAASVPFPLAPNLAQAYPDWIEETVRLFNFQVPVISIAEGENRYNEKHFYFADASFLKIFDFKLALGDAERALDKAGDVIISQAIAQKYFGQANPLGKEILFQGRESLRITGVWAEQAQYPSHLTFDFIASFETLKTFSVYKQKDNWLWNPCWTYILLHKDKPEAVAELEHHFPAFVYNYFPEEIRDFVSLRLQPIEDIHLHSQLAYEMNANGDVRYIYIFSVISLLVLLIASINFMNLATARASLRAKEVGVRKVIGAEREQLIKQFVFESFILSVLAILSTLIIMELSQPFIVALSGYDAEFIFSETGLLLAVVSVTGLLVGFLSSLYPAWYLSSFDPISVFKQQMRWGYGSRKFRRTLVVVQFVISIFLLISALITFKQLDFLKTTQLGFRKEQILFIPVPHTRLNLYYEKFKSYLLESDDIEAVTASQEVIGRSYQTAGYLPEGCDKENPNFFPVLIVRPDFLKTFDIELIAGRAFRSEYEYPNMSFPDENDTTAKPADWQPPILDDDSSAVIINRAMLEHLGWESAQEAIGKKMVSFYGQERVIGVVENFHFSSLHQSVSPLVIDIKTGWAKVYHTKYVVVRLATGRSEEAMAHVKKVWQQLRPDLPLDYFFLDENLNQMYVQEQKLGEIAGAFSILAFLTACMGLFGLSSFIVERKRKEIAIRKALGERTLSIIYGLNRIFLNLVWLSILIGWALAYIGIEYWLSGFAYHVTQDIDSYLWAALIIAVNTFLVVSVHTIRAALRQPIEIIRRE
ncbi:MAG: ABC transporter permease [Bernardetiaceae bacterium]|nr:ABC transporter permease [Bernardetiaceae bacterium]